MVVEEKVLEEKLYSVKPGGQKMNYGYVAGKKLTAEKLKKKMKHKPRLISTILVNLFILLAIITIGILIFGI